MYVEGQSLVSFCRTLRDTLVWAVLLWSWAMIWTQSGNRAGASFGTVWLGNTLDSSQGSHTTWWLQGLWPLFAENFLEKPFPPGVRQLSFLYRRQHLYCTGLEKEPIHRSLSSLRVASCRCLHMPWHCPLASVPWGTTGGRASLLPLPNWLMSRRGGRKWHL